MKKERILSVVFCVCLTAIIIFAFAVGINDCQRGVGAFAKSEDVYPITAARMSAKNAVYFDFNESVEDFTDRETESAKNGKIESEVESEQAASEEVEDNSVEYRGECNVPTDVCEVETLQSVDQESTTNHRPIYYGIWTGVYWHFTPEQIDAQWRGLKTSKPRLADGTTRAWQKYLYDRLSGIGAEWFFKFAVAQAMQESGFNPLNQQGNDAVPDKGLFSFRIWYWNSAYGDVFDYRANINAYVDRIAPYLTDSSEQGIYRAISQHYQPNGQTNMIYVNQVLGRLNELWEVE